MVNGSCFREDLIRFHTSLVTSLVDITPFLCSLYPVLRVATSSIWRMRSRVQPNMAPISSNV